MPLHESKASARADELLSVPPQFARAGEVEDIPRFRLPDGEMAADTAYQVIHDELMLDGNARLNLATFVTTWMEPQARLLMADCGEKNMIDKDEYPLTAEIEERCVSMLADLWRAEHAESPTGCSTLGSSEACMLGGMGLKWRWRARREAAGKPSDKPNLVMGANVQVCWEKFCRYWEIEPRMAKLAPGRTCLTPETAVELCDENTIGVVAILGSTFDGLYEPVAEIAAALDELQADQGLDIPMHVDGASGGFVAPFLDPDLAWDFRLPRVQSINASGHKYGLVYPGVGWAIWRGQEALPRDLVFDVNYLGGDMPTFGLNFSRPGSEVVAQYYNFLRLGRDGFTRVQQACRDTAQWLAKEIEAMDAFELVSDGGGIPVFAFRMADDVSGYTVYDVSAQLRQYGWLVPAYTYPEDLEHLAVLRIVVRNGFGHELARKLIEDLKRVVEHLAAGHGRGAPQDDAFHH